MLTIYDMILVGIGTLITVSILALVANLVTVGILLSGVAAIIMGVGLFTISPVSSPQFRQSPNTTFDNRNRKI